MHLRFDKYPIPLLFCILWSIVAFIFIFFNVFEAMRVIFGIPIVIFIPGYLLISVLFPEKKTEKGLDFIEKIALSLGISIAIVPLIGIVLNYTPWGIALEPIVLSLGVFIFVVGSIAVVRWYRTPIENRTILDVTLAFPQNETRIDRVISLILIVSIIAAAILLIYVVLTPRQGEHFTEFYVLGPTHQASDYPRNLSVGQNATVILGVINHEDMFKYYSIEVWLSNQTTIYNTSSHQNETVYHNLWFMDKIDFELPALPIDFEVNITKQWEYNYTFTISKVGDFKLVFLLYPAQVHHYSEGIDYKDSASEIVDNEQTTAYRNLHLWITVR